MADINLYFPVALRSRQVPAKLTLYMPLPSRPRVRQRICTGVAITPHEFLPSYSSTHVDASRCQGPRLTLSCLAGLYVSTRATRFLRNIAFEFRRGSCQAVSASARNSTPSCSFLGSHAHDRIQAWLVCEIVRIYFLMVNDQPY